MHPAHIQYLKFPAINTLDYFFKVIETLNPVKRDKIFESTYHFVIAPRFRAPSNDNEKIANLMLDKCDYGDFEKKCYELKKYTSDVFLIPSIMNFTLNTLLDYGDSFSLDIKIKRNQELVASLEKGTDLKNLEIRKQTIQTFKSIIDRLPEQTKEYYQLYQEFCESVIPKLFLERNLF